MGRRGPKPTPTPLLRIAGSWRAKRNKKEPQPEPSRADCPEWLDGDAKACWDRLVPQLETMGVLTRIDENALARYCQIWSEWRQCTDFIKKRGYEYPMRDEKGEVKCLVQFPRVGARNKLAQELARLEAEFGMTPSARSRIQVEKPKEAPNSLAAFNRSA